MGEPESGSDLQVTGLVRSVVSTVEAAVGGDGVSRPRGPCTTEYLPSGVCAKVGATDGPSQAWDAGPDRRCTPPAVTQGSGRLVGEGRGGLP